jgi:hypothetical protein
MQLHSDTESPVCRVNEPPHGYIREQGRALVYGHCYLKLVAPKRELHVRFAEGPTHVFRLRLTPRPEGWPFTAWYPVDAMKDTPDGATRPPRPEEVIEIRLGAR